MQKRRRPGVVVKGQQRSKGKKEKETVPGTLSKRSSFNYEDGEKIALEIGNTKKGFLRTKEILRSRGERRVGKGSKLKTLAQIS